MNSHLRSAVIYVIVITTVNVAAKYTINCDASSPCIPNTIVKIPPVIGNQVNINCTGDNICESVTFIFPDNVQANILCDGYYACFNATFDGLASNGLQIMVPTQWIPKNPILEQSHVICPKHGNCQIDVTSPWGMINSIIDASQTISGNLSVTTLLDWVLNGTDVYCPILGSCIVRCNSGYGAGANMNIHGQTSTGLVSYTVIGGEGASNSSIICPAVSRTGNINCKIDGISNYQNEFKDLNIYCMEGLSGVELHRVYFSPDEYPILHCGFGYGDSCQLVYDFINQLWSCKDTNSPCNN